MKNLVKELIERLQEADRKIEELQRKLKAIETVKNITKKF